MSSWIIIFTVVLNFLALEVAYGQFCETESCGSLEKEGHLKAFGDHRPPQGGIKTLKYSPSSADFYRRFVRGRTPVLIRGAANHWPAMTRWTNQSYLREHYGSTPFTVEYRKKFKNEQPIRKPLRLDKFLDIYETENVYLDSTFPPSAMLHDVILPQFLACKELSSKVNSMTLLLSNGNTTSPIHQDGYENVITVISGIKTFILIDPAYSEDLYADEHFLFAGILSFNGDAVDFAKFPNLAKVPYYEVTLYPGDMLYVPQYWWHLVRSKDSPNIAVNFWLDVFNFQNEFEEAGLDEEKDIVKINAKFDELVKQQPESIRCDNENPQLNKILKVNMSDPFSSFLRIPKKSEPPPDVLLASGYTMPVLGFGTFALRDTVSSVKTAIEAGYRLIDTAQGYPGSEESIGKAIQESNVPRENIFIVTKLHPKYLGYDTTLSAIELSLKALQTDYIDLFLIHTKVCDNLALTCGEGEPKGDWKDSWRAMEEMQRKGKIRSLGVSNFKREEVEELVEFAVLPVSAVQNWFDPFHQERKTRHFCSKNNIRYIGYSTLGTRWVYMFGLAKNPVLKSSIINEISYHYEYVATQVVLRWAIHMNVTVIPRSNSPRNIHLNYRTLDLNLTESEIDLITNIVDYEFHPLERVERGEGNCNDVDDTCQQRAKEGECVSNSAWMLDNCKNSCKLCYDNTNSFFKSYVYVGSEDQHMYAIDTLSGAIEWKFPTQGKILSTAAMSPDSEKLYFGSNDGNVYALQAVTGKLLWSFQAKAGIVAGPRISTSGTIYVGSHDGFLYALDPSANGSLIWRKSLGGPIFSSVAIGEEKGALYVGDAADNGPRIFGLSTKTGDILWEFSKAGKIMSSPALSSDGKTVYFCSLDHFIYALDTDTGSLVWSLDTGSEMESSPYISKSDGTLYVGLINEKLLAVNTLAGPLRGTVKWSLNTGGEVVSSPVVTENGTIYVGVGDGRILAINQTSSEIIWGPATNDYVAASVAVGSDSVVYAGSTDNTVYALNGQDGSIVWKVKTNGSISQSSPVLPRNERMALG